MAKTKTFSVEKFKDYVNAQMKRTDTGMTNEVRDGLDLALNEVLHSTGNYHGFQYVDWDEGGYQQWVDDGKPEDNTKYLGNQSKKCFY